MGRESVKVAVLGATGAVGREMLRELELGGWRNVRALASARSAGQRLPFAGGELVVEEVRPESFAGVQVALFSAGGDRSKQWAPIAKEQGAVVIDNSSAWRMDPEVPLVVPEVNPDALAAHRGIIANPNCSTIQMVLPLEALRRAVGIERVVVSTYQSASGAGQQGVDELRAGLRALVAGHEVPHRTFARPLAGDCVPHIGSFEASGYTNEELKMVYETRKILSLPALEVSATCVRVPVERVHQEAVTVDLGAAIEAEEARRLFAEMPGLEVLDVPERNVYPMARDAVGRHETYVGRIRRDVTRPATLHFWVVSDNLLKGAAWNAVQIADALYDQGGLREA